MKKSRYAEEQIIGILKQHEAGVKTADLCRELVRIPSVAGWPTEASLLEWGSCRG